MFNPEHTHEHQMPRDPSLGHKLLRIAAQQDFKTANYRKYASLTPREIEVIQLLVQDLNTAEIANLLFISQHTVQQHRKNIRRKLGVNTILQLFQFALAFDLV